MRKLPLLSIVSLMLTVTCVAQAYEGTIQFDKKKQDAIVIEYNFPPQAVENAIVQRIEKLGFRAKEEKGLLNKDKGFLVFKNAIIVEITGERIDYIIKVERKSRKEDDETELFLVLMKDDKNVLKELSAEDVADAKTFLNGMLPDIESAHLDLQIKEQEENIAKSEKKIQELKDDKSSLERRLEDNEKAQSAAQKQLESQRKTLETLNGRRKKS